MTYMRFAVASLVALAVSVQAWAAPPIYRVSELEGFRPGAINNSGQILGTSAAGSVLYSDGELIALGAGVRASDLNDLGQVTGRTADGAIVWRDGSLQVIGPGAGLSINNHGWVTGFYSRQEGPDETERAFLYDGSSFQDLASLYDPSGSFSGRALGVDINDAGHVLAGVHAEKDHAILFVDGTIHDVSLPSWQGGSYPGALNDRGQVAGYTDVLDPYLYDNGVFTVLPQGWGAEPVALNNQGTLLMNILTFISIYYSPLLYEGGETYVLSDYLGPSGRDLFMIMAYDMNDRGQILAQGVLRSHVVNGNFVYGDDLIDDGPPRYFVLTPVPEPQTYVLMLAGLLVLLIRCAQSRRLGAGWRGLLAGFGRRRSWAV